MRIGDKKMLENYQIITEGNEPKFAVIQYKELMEIKSLLSNKEKLEDLLDYLYIQEVKKESSERIDLAEIESMI